MALPKFFNTQFKFKNYPNTFWEGDNNNHIIFTHDTNNDKIFLRLWDNFDVGLGNVDETNKILRDFGKWSIDDGKLIITSKQGVKYNFPNTELSRIEKFWVDNYVSEPVAQEVKPKPKEDKNKTKKEEPVTKKEEPVQDLKRTKPEFDLEKWKEQNQLASKPQKPPIDCSEWVNNNLFESNFKEDSQEQAAQDFVNWYVSKKPTFLERYSGVCGFTPEGTFTDGKIHKNGLVRFMSRIVISNKPGDTFFNMWLKEYQNTNKDKFKDDVTMKENVIQKLKSIKETKSLKESLINKLKDKKNQKKIHETKIERELFKLQESYDRKNKIQFYSNFGSLISRYKKSSLYLTENVDQTFTDAFKFVFSENDEQIKKETISRLFKSLGIEEGTQIANEISEKLMSMETTEIYLNCLKVSSIILSTMITSITTELSSESTGSLEGMVKSVINTSLNSSDNMEKLKYQINNVVCPVLEGYKTKIVDMPKEISNAFTNMI